MTEREVKFRITADTSELSDALDDTKKKMSDVGKDSQKVTKEATRWQRAFKGFSEINGTTKKIAGTMSDMSAKFKAAGTAGRLAMAGATAGILAGAGLIVVGILKKITDISKSLAMAADPVGASMTYSKLSHAINRLKGALGQLINSGFFQMLIEGLTWVVNGLTRVVEAIGIATGFIMGLVGATNVFKQSAQGAAEGVAELAEAGQGLAAFDKLNNFGDGNLTAMQEATQLKAIQEGAYNIGQKMNASVLVFFNNMFTTLNSGLGTVFNGLRSFAQTIGSVVNGFTGLIGGVFGNLKDGFETVVNGVVGLFKGAGNFIIGILNTVIDLYNSTIGQMRIDNDYLNLHIGFPTWSRIPALASGGVIEPNNPRAVIVGDNTREKEIVSPLSLMQQALTEVLQREGQGQTVELKVNLDSRTIARAVYDPLQRERTRRGVPY